LQGARATVPDPIKLVFDHMVHMLKKGIRNSDQPNLPRRFYRPYRKSRLKAHGFNRGIKGGVARQCGVTISLSSSASS
jgi:hypothetical protein